MPNKYRSAVTRQAEAEQNIERALSGVAPEVAGEIVRRVAVDPFYSEDERAGLDLDAKAYTFHLQQIRRELGKQ